MSNKYLPDAINGTKKATLSLKKKIAEALIYAGNISEGSEIMRNEVLHDRIIAIIDHLGKGIKEVVELESEIKRLTE